MWIRYEMTSPFLWNHNFFDGILSLVAWSTQVVHTVTNGFPCVCEGTRSIIVLIVVMVMSLFSSGKVQHVRGTMNKGRTLVAYMTQSGHKQVSKSLNFIPD